MSHLVTPAAYQRAVDHLHAGHVIAYPTEGVFGFGCDPTCEAAVMRLLALKNRSVTQGLILIAADFAAIEPWVEALPEARQQAVMATWPGPVTWIFPASRAAPAWIRGQHPSIAVRITAHPGARQLCELWGSALVSTSANRHGQPPLREYAEVYATFNYSIDYILPGSIGTLQGPTTIRDALTGNVLRK